MYRILLIEKNPACATKVASVLKEPEYEIVQVTNSIEGIAMLTQKPFEGMILCAQKLSEQDIIMLHTVQSLKPQIKSFMLAEELDPELEKRAIDERVNFCALKSRDMSVTLKYIDRDMRVTSNYSEIRQDAKLTSAADRLIIDQISRKIYKDGTEVKVSQKEYEILRLLLSNCDKALSREEIVQKIWDIGIEKISTRAIDGHIKRLRSKLDLSSIVTVRGYGYKWSESA